MDLEEAGQHGSELRKRYIGPWPYPRSAIGAGLTQLLYFFVESGSCLQD